LAGGNGQSNNHRGKGVLERSRHVRKQQAPRLELVEEFQIVDELVVDEAALALGVRGKRRRSTKD
jgi:hypothetical protein